jgi:hypothetical protein
MRQLDLLNQGAQFILGELVHQCTLSGRGDTPTAFSPTGVDALGVERLRCERRGLLLEGALADVRLQVLLEHGVRGVDGAGDKAAEGRTGIGGGIREVVPTVLRGWERSVGAVAALVREPEVATARRRRRRRRRGLPFRRSTAHL